MKLSNCHLKLQLQLCDHDSILTAIHNTNDEQWIKRSVFKGPQYAGLTEAVFGAVSHNCSLSHVERQRGRGNSEDIAQQ